MGKIIIREATEKDTAAMARVNVDTRRVTYQDFYPAELMAARTYQSVETNWRKVFWESPEIENYVFVAENEQKLVIGIMVCGPSREQDSKNQGEIYILYVLPEYHGQGIGKKLVQRGIEKLLETHRTSMIIWVLSENPARHFYEALGGIQVAEKEIDVGGIKLKETGYGWEHLECNRSGSPTQVAAGAPE